MKFSRFMRFLMVVLLSHYLIAPAHNIAFAQVQAPQPQDIKTDLDRVEDRIRELRGDMKLFDQVIAKWQLISKLMTAYMISSQAYYRDCQVRIADFEELKRTRPKLAQHFAQDIAACRDNNRTRDKTLAYYKDRIGMIERQVEDIKILVQNTESSLSTRLAEERQRQNELKLLNGMNSFDQLDGLEKLNAF